MKSFQFRRMKSVSLLSLILTFIGVVPTLAAKADIRNVDTGIVYLPVRHCADPMTGICIFSNVTTRGVTEISYSSSGSLTTITKDHVVGFSNHSLDWGMYSSAWIEHYRPSLLVRSPANSCFVWVSSGTSYTCFDTAQFTELWHSPIPNNQYIRSKYVVASSWCCTYLLTSSSVVGYTVFP